MKKWICAIVCLLILCAGTGAGKAERFTGWIIRAENIRVEKRNDAVDLSPSLVLKISMREDIPAVQLALEACKGDESIAGCWMEEYQAFRMAFSNGETCMVYGNGPIMRLTLLQALGLDLSSDEKLSYYANLSNFLAKINSVLQDPRSFADFVAKRAEAEWEEDHLNCTFSPDQKTKVTFSLFWDKAEWESPLFDMGQKRDAVYQARKGIWATEGFPQAIIDMQNLLMQDETVKHLLQMMGLAVG